MLACGLYKLNSLCSFNQLAVLSFYTCVVFKFRYAECFIDLILEYEEGLSYNNPLY